MSLSSPVARTELHSCADIANVKADQLEGVAPQTLSAGSDREEQIRQAGLDMQNSYWQYGQTGDFGALGEAHRHRLHMTELIRSRSPEYVSRLEAERGLA